MQQKRGADGHRIRPPQVVRAIIEGDTPTLQAMQRASVRSRKLKRDAKARIQAEELRKNNEAIYAEGLAQDREMEFYLRDLQANMHICPID